MARSMHEPRTSTYHAPSANGNDATLCGYAYEGEGLDDTDPIADELVDSDQRVNCPDCVTIIRYCKAIRSADYDRQAAGKTEE